MINKKTRVVIVILVLIVTLVTGTFYGYQQSQISTMEYSTFITYLESEQVKTVNIVNADKLHIVLENNRVYQVSNPQKENMKEYFLLNGAEVGNTSDPFQRALQILGVGVLAFVIVYYLKKRTGKDAMQIVDVQGQQDATSPTYTFNSIAGNDEAKDLVKDIIDFIKSPIKYAKMGAKMPKGILLYGPPGTGKTLMAKAIAGEAKVPFYAVSGSDFIQMYVGVGASRIRQLFKKAKKSQKAVIFIDEVDAIGKKRGNGSSQSNDERDQTLNALLTEMSGFNHNQGIVVIAATNRLDTLDEALIRPGRFDRMIEIGLPDMRARKRILDLHVEGKPLHKKIDIEKVAKETVYFSGAMLESLVNEAAIIAANSDEKEINNAHLDQALYTVIAGAAKKDRSSIHNKDKEITAYHEAGHAVATKILLPGNTVSKVTIIPSTRGYGGFSMSIPEDRLYKTKCQLLSDIKVLLAGRAAEELAFGLEHITTGASNDIEKASRLIKEYIVKFGMDEEYGLFNAEAAQMGMDKEIIEKCRNKMKEYYDEIKMLLQQNEKVLYQVTKSLMIKETLGEKEINHICEQYIA